MLNLKEKQINVLQLISTLEVGGAEKLLIELLKSSKNQELPINFTVVVMNNLVNQALKDEILDIGYDIYFLNRNKGDKNPQYFFKIKEIIDKHNINIIHSHNYGSKIWSVLCKVLNPQLKLFFTVHDTNIFNNSNKLNIFLHRHFIDKNIAISKSVLEECQYHKISKTSHIYNGINLNKFFNNTTITNNPPETLNIINVSRIEHPKKGQDILIRALKECKDRGLKFKCQFVGGVYYYSQESYEFLNKLVKDLDLEDDILFLGNRDDIPDLLRKSDLFVLASRYEGQGLVILEAMASKLPVIASNVDGPAELIRHEENGFLFQSENSHDLADKIMNFYSNREKMDIVSQAGFKFVQDFDISVMAQKYYELYKSA